MKFRVPIKLPSLANLRVHFWAMAKLKKGQRKKVKYAMRDLIIPRLPLTVTITRLGPRRLDDDNLAASCKYVRDEIAAKVGTDDGSSLYTWVYKQCTGKYAVDIEIVQR